MEHPGPSLQRNFFLSAVALKFGIDIPLYIVSQFRWLDKIVDCNALIEKIFEIMSLCDVAVQKELISCLPDLINEEKHAEVSIKLRDLLLDSRPM